MRQPLPCLTTVSLVLEPGAMEPSRDFFALASLACVALFGCGTSSSSAPSGSSGTTGNATTTACPDVCAAVTKACGTAPPGCESTCANFSETTKQCLVSVSTCDAVNQCASAAPTSPDASSNKPSGDACDSCTSSQFCVTEASGSRRCFDPPATCNGSTTEKCPCLQMAGSGVCATAAKSCSEGLANRVTCR